MMWAVFGTKSNEERESSRLDTDNPDLKRTEEEEEVLFLTGLFPKLDEDEGEDKESSITCILRSPPPSNAALETTRFTALYEVSK